MLQRGQRFTMNGVRWRVAYVSDLRAHCVATMKQSVTRTDPRGTARTYLATRRLAIDIAPTAAVDLLEGR